MIEVWINDMLLDLRPTDVVALTKQINDIAEIQKRNADFTNRFQAPATPNNRLIAQMLNVPGNTSSIPYKYGKAKIISDGIIIANGATALCVETKNQSIYEYIIYAGNYDLYSKILDKYITDLDWSDLVHGFSKAEYYNSWSNTDGYIYPIAETLDGTLRTGGQAGRGVDIRYQVPHVFVKTIWERIFKEAGLEYYGDFFEENETFKNELVPACSNRGLLITDDFIARYTTPAINYNRNDYNYYEITQKIEPNIIDTDTLLGWNNSNKRYYAQKYGLFTFNFELKTRFSYLHKIRLEIRVNGSWVYRQDFDVNFYDIYFQEFTHSITHTQILDNYDYVEFYFILIPIEIAYSYPTVGWYDTATVSVKNEVTSHYRQTIDFKYNLPKVLQKDFLTAIMQQYGLLYRLDINNRYEFITIDDLLNGKAGISDLSYNYNSESSETYRIGSYGKLNDFTYRYYSKDLLGENYADALFPIDIDDLNNKSEVVGSNIEACGDYLTLQAAGKIASIHVYEKSEDYYKIKENNELKTVLLNRTVGLYLILYDDNTSIYRYIDTDELVPFVKFAPLHWQVLMEEYYPSFIKLVQKPVKKNVSIMFNSMDIYFLNMFKIIYLEQYQSYFYLNKINNFIAGKPSDCEIIKIN